MQKSSAMLASLDELKEFLVWAREQKIVQLVIGDITVTFSGLAMMDKATARPAGEMFEPDTFDDFGDPLGTPVDGDPAYAPGGGPAER